MKNIKEFYRAKYKGSLFIVKAGGRMITDKKSRTSLIRNIHDLTTNGMKVLLIYGGGQAIDNALIKQGIKPRKIDGRRITGPKEIKIVKNVMSADLSYRIASTMAELKLHGLCLSSLPAGWTNISIRPRENPEDEGYDGTIKEIYSDQIRRMFDTVNFIVTPCIGVTNRNGVNINADNVAVAIAAGCQSRKLIFLSDVDGVLVNDKIADMPVIVTFCPLCYSAIVFDRRLDGHTLGFGVSGLLRNSDMIMYDLFTESYWQQFTGEAIVGEFTGKKLIAVPDGEYNMSDLMVTENGYYLYFTDNTSKKIHKIKLK